MGEAFVSKTSPFPGLSSSQEGKIKNACALKKNEEIILRDDYTVTRRILSPRVSLGHKGIRFWYIKYKKTDNPNLKNLNLKIHRCLRKKKNIPERTHSLTSNLMMIYPPPVRHPVTAFCWTLKNFRYVHRSYRSQDIFFFTSRWLHQNGSKWYHEKNFFYFYY